MHMPSCINDRLDCAKHRAPPYGKFAILDFPGPPACSSCYQLSRQMLLIMGGQPIMGILHPDLWGFLVVFSAAPLAPNASGEPRPAAGARDERRLLGVGSTAGLNEALRAVGPSLRPNPS